MRLDLILIGFGNVGRRFAALIEEQRARLARDHELSLRIIGIATRHGQVIAPNGIPRPSDSSFGAPLGEAAPTPATLAFLRDALARSRPTARARRLVVVETTTLDIVRGEPAISHVRVALAGGAHVVTANKGPVAFAHRTLSRIASRANRRWLFEGAVMDGIPVFNLIRETLPAVRIVGFRGVINTTTNYILEKMETGQSFDDALREMQAQGIAEADASLDVDGWDAAAKIAALANVLLDARVTPRTVARQGIDAEMAVRAREARRHGRRLKLVARARRNGVARTVVPGHDLVRSIPAGDGVQAVPNVTASVGPEELPADDLLAGLTGHQNALILDTDLLGEIAIVQRGGSLTHTAYALLSDLVTIAADVRNARATGQSPPQAPRGRSRRSRGRRSQ